MAANFGLAEDNSQYVFYPIPTGSIYFQVRASNDAHIALAMSREGYDPKIEIFIGGWGNKKSSISRKRSITRSVEVETPAILNGAKFRGFWVRWDYGIVSVGHENRPNPFMSWHDIDPFSICYVGFRTDWNATGTWKIEGRDELVTKPSQEYVFKPCTTGSLEFEYHGSHNCCVCLTTTLAIVEPFYEIILGGPKNPTSKIRCNKRNSEKVTVATHRLDKEHRKFSVEWQTGKVVVRLYGAVIMEWTDPLPFPITHFGVRTGKGDWRIKHFPTNWHSIQH